MLSETTQRETARHIKGTTIAWSGDRCLDLANPNPGDVTIEDYAYALAYTVRWRGQAESDGRRCFYGVAEHVVRGAEHMMLEGHGPRAALDFLGHESDEVPFGDFPGPGKAMWSPEFRASVKCWGDALDRRFGFGLTDKALIKRFDIRMLATEKRDLMPGHARTTWEDYDSPDPAYGPFAARIVPFAHPDQAAERFLLLERTLRQMLATNPMEIIA